MAENDIPEGLPNREAAAPEAVAQRALETGGGPRPSGSMSTEPTVTRLTLYALSSAVCAVIPIPFLDSHLLRRVRRRMVREIATDSGVALNEPEVRHLSGTDSTSPLGCVFGVLIGSFFKLVYQIVRRVFRTIMFWLMVKDAADAASKTFHEGFLVGAGMESLAAWKKSSESIQVPAATATATTTATTTETQVIDLVSQEVRWLRHVIDRTTRDADTRVIQGTIRGVLRGSRSLLAKAARPFARRARLNEKSDPTSEPAPEQVAELAPDLVDAMTSALLREKRYLDDLERHFLDYLHPT